MGAIIGPVIGGIGSLVGGATGSADAFKGFDYLKKNVQGYVNNGNTANADSAALLTGGPNSPQAQSAFKNYLSSTGYNFQKQQGTSAITGSAAARGILNSGSTAKALVKYGNDLASTGYDNYLGHLNTLSQSGLDAAKATGEAGTTGGSNAGQMAQGGISSAGGQFGTAASSFFGSGGGNPMSSLPANDPNYWTF